jgi:hypothetical protein
MTGVAAIREYLLAGRNPDGGWGYARGKGSRLEPTCCAVMALGDSQIARAALTSWPARDGLLLERRGGDPNYGFHALALLALGAARVEHAAGNAPLITGLQRAGGLRLAPSTINRQDNQLQGWSWIPDTFSWVEPTAWGVLALKRARALGWPGVDDTRLNESESLLFDRVSTTGGWNYGNSNMLGTELHAYVPTTAVALLALQDKRDDPAVQRSVAFLAEHATWECSSYALGLAAIALRAYGRDVSAALEALERQISVTFDLDQQLGVALALLALHEENATTAFAL